MQPDNDSSAASPRSALTLAEDAAALGAFRVVGETGRCYTSPWAGPKWISHLFRMARATGMVTAHTKPDTSYAVLDVYDAEGSVIQDFAIPTRQAVKWWYRKLELRMVRYGDQ
jgi:hypothetical protein